MQVNWIIKKSGNSSLLVVAQGWGSSAEVIANQKWAQGYDVVSLCDYRELCSAELDFTAYEYKVLVAWSFGVWASEQLFEGGIFDRAIAIAGTPRPIDRQYGIDPRIFQLTLRGVLEEGVVRFVARMCGSHLKDYLRNHSTRELEEIKQELTILGEKGRTPAKEGLNWSKAIVPLEDKIFSVSAMKRYWSEREVPIIELPHTPHYPFYDKEFILCITTRD